MKPDPGPDHADALLALNRVNRDIYAGTVPDHVKANRRAAGKRAKAARKINRRPR